MRPSFMILMAIGLGLMGYYWWVGWEAEEASLALTTSGPVRGCASPDETIREAGACEAPMDQCLSLEVLPTGVCSAPCAATKDCPEHWCCVTSPKASTKMCAPPTVCIRSDIK